MKIETRPTQLNRKQEEVFAFLAKLENFRKLMPDRLEKFELLSEDSFLFSLQGMPEIVLERKSQEPPHRLVLGASGGKLPFTLSADITGAEEGRSEVAFSFQGEFNPMMSMMVKGPITHFMNTLSENLGKL